MQLWGLALTNESSKPAFLRISPTNTVEEEKGDALNAPDLAFLIKIDIVDEFGSTLEAIKDATERSKNDSRPLKSGEWVYNVLKLLNEDDYIAGDIVESFDSTVTF